jgi:hypothetical protein
MHRHFDLSSSTYTHIKLIGSFFFFVIYSASNKTFFLTKSQNKVREPEVW